MGRIEIDHGALFEVLYPLGVDLHRKIATVGGKIGHGLYLPHDENRASFVQMLIAFYRLLRPDHHAHVAFFSLRALRHFCHGFRSSGNNKICDRYPAFGTAQRRIIDQRAGNGDVIDVWKIKVFGFVLTRIGARSKGLFM